MGKTLLCLFFKKIFFIGLLFGVGGDALAQSAGDIAFIGIDRSSSGFAIVALADLPPNTTIFFTDADLKGPVYEREGIRWETGNNHITAGSVVTFHNINSEKASVSVGNIDGKQIDLSSPNTTFFAYTGSDMQTPGTFLTAISNRGEQDYGDTMTTGEEGILLNGTVMQAAYRGVREGKSAEEYLRLIRDTENNWQQEVDQWDHFTIDETSFTFLEAASSAGSDQPVFVIPLEGDEGWKGVSSPAHNISLEQLLGDVWIQKTAGTDDPGGEATILSWEEQEGGFFKHPETLAEYAEPGRGYFVYVPEDDDPNRAGIQGGFPKMLSVNNPLQDRVVDIYVSATDADESGSIDGMEGFNLLGNPFGSTISVGAVKEEFTSINTNINNYIYVWNAEMGGGNGGFELLKDPDVIDPIQPFWVRYLEDGVNGIARFDRDRLTEEAGREIHGSSNDPAGSFELKLGAEKWFDTYRIEIREEGKVGEDRLDGYKLFSLKPGSINLYSPVGNGNRLARNVLPHRLEQAMEIPLMFSTSDRSSLSFSWERPDDLPRDWDLILRDQKENREVNLRTSNSYNFKLETTGTDVEEAVIPPEQSLLNIKEEPSSEERFFLTIRPSDSMGENVAEEMPESIRLKPNYPNPFTNTTTIPYELDEATEVTLTVWNMIGQKVATLIDGELKSAGPHDEDSDISWNATNMPSGMYIARLEAGGEVFTRKMTLIK